MGPHLTAPSLSGWFSPPTPFLLGLGLCFDLSTPASVGLGGCFLPQGLGQGEGAGGRV